jgi:lysophospholipase L1-like esterase
MPGRGIGPSKFLRPPVNQGGGGNPPVNVVAPVLSGTPQPGQVLTSTTGTWSGDLPITYSYVFLRTLDFVNFEVIQSGGSNTYTVLAGDFDYQIRVNVIAINGILPNGFASSNYVGPIGVAPSIVTEAVVSGLNMVGEVLTTTNGTYDGTPPIMFQYQWQRSTDGGVNWTIIGLDQNTYTLVSGDSNALVRCVVIAFNDFGSVSNFSNSLNIVAQGLVNLQSYNASKFTLVGSKISAWADQDAAKSSWSQGLDARRPTLTAGQPIFPGAGSFMQRNSGELALTTFSAYIVVRNQGKTNQAGFFSGITSGNWINDTNMWQASTGRSGFIQAHTGNRIVVLTFKRNGNNVEFFYNNRVLRLTNPPTWSGQNSLIGNIMGLSWNNGWSINGACLSAYIAAEYHTEAQSQDVINGLYDRYNLGSNTAIDNILAIGDSNTFGSGSTSYIVGLATQLSLMGANLGISGCYMSNGGITANAVINRTNQIITRPGTDYISICAGTNDIVLGSVPVATYEAALNTILTRLQASGQNMSRVCLSSVPYQRDGANAAQLVLYRTAVENQATLFGTKYFDLYGWMLANGQNSLMGDPVHLNQTAQNGWQAGVFTALTT